MADSKVVYKIRVTGRVQGVGFRQACLREARYRGIFGMVKNISDGSVYIEAEGTMAQLNEFVNWCKRGPGYGSVEDISVEQGHPANYNSFTIRY